MMAETLFEIPLSSGSQQFSIKLGENPLQVRLVWREAEGGGWFMDLSDDAGESVIAGVPLRCGHDLLEEHAHLGLGKMTVTLDGETDRDPAYADRGTRVQLHWAAA